MKRYFSALIFCLCLCLQAVSAADVTESNAATLSQQGIAAFKRGDYQNAIKYLSVRARMTPEDANVYYYLGNCYLQTKQNEPAARMFSTCVKTAPASQAGRFALTALEAMSIAPKAAAPEPVPSGPDPAATAASKDSLMSEKALDKSLKDSIARIKIQRQTFKRQVDRVFEDLEDDLTGMNSRNTPNYAVELERVRRDADNKVENMHARELRYESRLLAPEKIDVRAVPKMPEEKNDDSNIALGSLAEMFKPDKPFDPFGTDITPEITAKFMTIKDVFGELATYQPSARKMAKLAFVELKRNIENKQDSFDQQLYQAKANLIRDVAQAMVSYGNTLNNRQITPSYHLASSRIPRSSQNNASPMDQEIAQIAERAKKRIKELEDSYYRDVDSYISGAKERVGGMVAQVGQMNRQLQRPSGNIMIVPLGTDVYTRNYVNFGDRPELSQPTGTNTVKASKVQALRAEAQKINPNRIVRPTRQESK